MCHVYQQICLSHIVSEILYPTWNNGMSLKSGLTPFKVIENSTIRQIAFYSNYGPILYRLWDIKHRIIASAWNVLSRPHSWIWGRGWGKGRIGRGRYRERGWGQDWGQARSQGVQWVRTHPPPARPKWSALLSTYNYHRITTRAIITISSWTLALTTLHHSPHGLNTC